MNHFRVKIVTSRFVCTCMVLSDSNTHAVEAALSALKRHTLNFVQAKDPAASIPQEAYKVIESSATLMHTDIFNFNWDLRVPLATNPGADYSPD